MGWAGTFSASHIVSAALILMGHCVCAGGAGRVGWLRSLDLVHSHFWYIGGDGRKTGLCWDAGPFTGPFSHSPWSPRTSPFAHELSSMVAGLLTSGSSADGTLFTYRGPWTPSQGFIGSRVFWPSMKKATGEKNAVSFSNFCLKIDSVATRRLLRTFLAPLIWNIL